MKLLLETKLGKKGYKTFKSKLEAKQFIKENRSKLKSSKIINESFNPTKEWQQIGSPTIGDLIKMLSQCDQNTVICGGDGANGFYDLAFGYVNDEKSMLEYNNGKPFYWIHEST